MTMNLNMPSNVTKAEPGAIYKPMTYIFDHVPFLKELLVKHRGVPGFQYLQCAVVNLRRAQDEGWLEVDNTVIYTIRGPKGEVDMKLLCRGKRIPGQPYDSGARLCFGDKTAEALTGLWINPENHEDDPEEVEEESEEFGSKIITAEAIEPTRTSVKVKKKG